MRRAGGYSLRWLLCEDLLSTSPSLSTAYGLGW
jgi:hypothetical protein